MSLTILANVLDTVPLALQLDDGDPSKFPRATILSEVTGLPISTVDMAHTNDGNYLALFLIPTASKFLVQYVVFDDAARTVISTAFTRALDLIVADYTPPTGSVPPVLNASSC